MGRPSITLKCVADNYASPRERERIAEFGSGTTGGPGGLLSLRRQEDGTLDVHVYRTDPGVRVFASTTEPTLSAALLSWWRSLDNDERALTGVEWDVNDEVSPLSAVTAEADFADVQAAVIKANKAAEGDSNDAEIELLRDAMELALTRWPEVDTERGRS